MLLHLRLSTAIRDQREQIASFIDHVADKELEEGSEESQTQLGQLTGVRVASIEF